MRVAAAEATSSQKIKQNVLTVIFDDDFVQQVRENMLSYEPICELINECQSQSTSLADAVGLWLLLELPNDNYANKVEARKKMAFNVYALTAYYLHPLYNNNKLSKQHVDEINAFLF